MSRADNVREERWQTLLVSPDNLLRLLRFAADGAPVQAPTLPPDTFVRDAGFDTERGCYVVVLESAFFLPVRVEEEEDGGVLRGDWEELLLSLGGDTPPAPPLEPLPEPSGPVPWEAYLLAPEDILTLLRLLADGHRVASAAVPPDARPVDAFFNPERRLFALVLESALFAPARPRRVGGVLHLPLPERLVELRAG